MRDGCLALADQQVRVEYWSGHARDRRQKIPEVFLALVGTLDKGIYLQAVARR
jgi:hypothetical protein